MREALRYIADLAYDTDYETDALVHINNLARATLSENAALTPREQEWQSIFAAEIARRTPQVLWEAGALKALAKSLLEQEGIDTDPAAMARGYLEGLALDGAADDAALTTQGGGE